MIVAERNMKITVSEMERFGEAMSDGRLTAPSTGKTYNLRAAIIQSKQLGRPLTDTEMKAFEL